MYFAILQDPGTGVLEIVECTEKDDPVLLARGRNAVLIGVKLNRVDAEKLIQSFDPPGGGGERRGSTG